MEGGKLFAVSQEGRGATPRGYREKLRWRQDCHVYTVFQITIAYTQYAMFELA